MKQFKFFQKGTLDDPQMLNELTRATASFNADTPEGYNGRRHLYHRDPELYGRLSNPLNNNEMERYFYDRELRRETTQPTLSQQEGIRTINGGGNIHNDNHGNTDYVPFSFGTTRVTRVNPKWWMKIKIFFQKISLYSDQIFPITIFSILITVIVSAVIAKILNIW